MPDLLQMKQRLTAPAPAGSRVLEDDGDAGKKGRAYRISDTIASAIYVADLLGKPLLVAGEPGCGKTELGYAAALRLGTPRLHFFSVKSTSEARDLFYTYDALRRFHTAQLAALGDGGHRDEEGMARKGEGAQDYISYEALGRAILLAHEPGQVKGLVRSELHPHYLRDETRKPCRSVVIIDEIDKAPRDFCNDMLREIEELSFRVRELDEAGRALTGLPVPNELWPRIFITSNQETQLPDAFLRRCVFLWIDFPAEEELAKIIDAHLGPGDSDGRFTRARDSLVKLFSAFRAANPQKPPGVAELLDAARLLAAMAQEKGEAGLRDGNWGKTLRHTLVKLKDDAEIYDFALESWKAGG